MDMRSQSLSNSSTATLILLVSVTSSKSVSRVTRHSGRRCGQGSRYCSPTAVLTTRLNIFSIASWSRKLQLGDAISGCFRRRWGHCCSRIAFGYTGSSETLVQVVFAAGLVTVALQSVSSHITVFAWSSETLVRLAFCHWCGHCPLSNPPFHIQGARRR